MPFFSTHFNFHTLYILHPLNDYIFNLFIYENCTNNCFFKNIYWEKSNNIFWYCICAQIGTVSEEQVSLLREAVHDVSYISFLADYSMAIPNLKIILILQRISAAQILKKTSRHLVSFSEYNQFVSCHSLQHAEENARPLQRTNGRNMRLYAHMIKNRQE